MGHWALLDLPPSQAHLRQETAHHNQVLVAHNSVHWGAFHSVVATVVAALADCSTDLAAACTDFDDVHGMMRNHRGEYMFVGTTFSEDGDLDLTTNHGLGDSWLFQMNFHAMFLLRSAAVRSSGFWARTEPARPP